MSSLIEMKYPSELWEIWRIADRNAIRYALGNVCLDFKNSRVEATNGRILVRHTVEWCEELAIKEPVLLWSGDLKKVSKLFRGYERSSVKLGFDGANWYAGTSELRHTLQIGEGKWPNTESIFANPPEQYAKIFVNAGMLKRLCAVCGAFDEAIELHIPLDGTTQTASVGGCGGRLNGRLSLMADDKEGKCIQIVKPVEAVQ
jgi:hypothetical protein